MKQEAAVRRAGAVSPERAATIARWLGFAIAVVAVVGYPMVASRFQVSLGTEAIYLAIWALSLHLMLGNLGMLSFGHAAYLGLGAYTVALMLKRTDLPYGLAFVCAPLLSAAGAALVGFFCIRLRHPVYFAMLTLAFAQIIYTTAFQWYDFTGGDNGVLGFGLDIPSALRTSPRALYYFSLAVGAGCLGAIWLITHSPFGMMLRAIRENPERAEAMGVPVQAMRFSAFVLAGLFAGVAGALLATFQRAIFPETLYWVRSGEVVIIVLLGGMDHFLGPVVGALVYLLLNQYIGTATQYWQLVLGLVLLAVVLFFRGGILGFVDDALRFAMRWRRAARRPPAAPVAEAEIAETAAEHGP